MKHLLFALVFLFLSSSAIAGFLRSDSTKLDTSKEAAEEAVANVDNDEVPVEEAVANVDDETPVKKVKAASETAKERKQEYYRFSVGTKRDDQNIRSSPNGEIIGTAPKGTTGYLIAQGNEWSLVEVKGEIAYMATRYLQFEQIPQSEYPYLLE
ncbi:MAG: SH3 domain-containing protein [Lachnospiraceae bacterium]|nr:SH3 domain-containing protein [Lachnospiraceae bacterium]